VKWIKQNMPEVKEIMFDDDTFTDSANLHASKPLLAAWVRWE
jgi:hypothetical protein